MKIVKPYMWFVMILTFLFSFCTHQKKESDVIIDIPRIAGKTPDEVEKILGKPDSSFTQTIVTKRIFTQLYDKNTHEIEIQYPSGKATDIVINKPMPLPFEPTTLSSFGIQPKGPTYVTPNAAMSWDNIPGFDQVTFYVFHMYNKDSVDNYKIYFKSK